MRRTTFADPTEKRQSRTNRRCLGSPVTAQLTAFGVLSLPDT
jgi:hypothetical protein